MSLKGRHTTMLSSIPRTSVASVFRRAPDNLHVPLASWGCVRTYFGRRTSSPPPSSSSDPSPSPQHTTTTSKFTFKPLQRLDDHEPRDGGQPPSNSHLGDGSGGLVPKAAPLPRAKRRLSFQFEEPEVDLVVDDMLPTMKDGGGSRGLQQSASSSPGVDVEETLPPLDRDDDDDLVEQYTTSPNDSSSTSSADTLLATAAASRRAVAARHEFSDRKTRAEGDEGDDGWGSMSIDSHVQRLFEAGKSPSFADYQAKKQRAADDTILP